MDKIPILADTEAETSMEQDEEEEIHRRISTGANKQNATSTLFNITYESSDDEACVEYKDYESRLRNNMKDWKSLYLNAYKDYKLSKEKHPVVDKCILPTEKLKYLDQSINLQNFIRESLEFRQKATLFLEYDYAEFIEMQQNLEDMCERKLNLVKANKTAENLSNIEE